MKRCKWAVPTPKINDKYESGPCEIMIIHGWWVGGLPVLCNGWKAICLGKHPEIIDKRDLEKEGIENET